MENVKYLIPLLLLLSCKNEISDDSVEVSLKEIFVEYKIMTFDEFEESEVIYKPDNVTLTFSLYSKIDTSLELNFSQDQKAVNSFFYWLNNKDSIELTAFEKKQTLLPKQKLEMTFMVPYNSFVDLQNIFKKRNINSINQSVKESRFVFKGNIASNPLFFGVDFDETQMIFNFSDTTIFLPPLEHR